MRFPSDSRCLTKGSSLSFISRQKGFSLLLIIMVILGLGLAGLGAVKLIGRIGEINRQRQVSVDLTRIQTAAGEYYRGHSDTGLPGTPGETGSVPVVDFGLESKYLHDAWGGGIQYYRGRTTAAAGVPSIVEVTVDGVDAAGYVHSYGPNQINDSAFASGGYGVKSIITRGGDDILLPLSVMAEAIKIADQELLVLSSKSCSLHIASGSWFDNWPNFLFQFGLADTYRYDPWDSEYVWDTDHWVSYGPDQIVSNDDLSGTYLTEDACPYAAEDHEPIDTFDDEDLPYWTFAWGEYGVAEYNGDNALDVEETWFNILCNFSLFSFNWAVAAAPPYNEDCDLNAAWLDAGRTLSYDAQVKVAVPASVPDFAAGISLRVDQIGHLINRYPGYGVSFIRSDGIGDDDIPDNIHPPEDDKTYIVLWYRTDAGCVNSHILAYKELSGEVSFFDDMESGVNGWTGDTGASGDNVWRQVTDGGDTFWHIRTSNNGNWRERELISPLFDLPSTTPIALTFDNQRTGLWSDSGSRMAYGRVYISVNGGAWTQLAYYNDTSSGWDEETIDLSAYAGSANVRIIYQLRYYNVSNSNRCRWRIDDVKIAGEFPVDMSTLVVRVMEQDEPEILNFNNGDVEPAVGSTIYQRRWSIIDWDWETTVSATVTGVNVTSGSWASNNAAGTITVTNKNVIVADWNNAGWPGYLNDLLVGGTVVAELSSVASAGSRHNDIKVYYGLPYETPSGHTGDTDPYNENRLANPRGLAYWPPDEGVPYTADMDFFTLVEWDYYDADECALIGTDTIRDSHFTTPGSGAVFEDLEIGLHSWGNNGSGSGDDVYFDDFSMQPH